MSKSVVFTLGQNDTMIDEWLSRIPPRYRSHAIRIALSESIMNGSADPARLFPWIDMGKMAADKAAEQSHPDPTRERQKPEQRSQPKQSAESAGATRKPGTPPSRDADHATLVQWTLDNLPPEATPEMRAEIAKYPRIEPYTMNDLIVLMELYQDEKEHNS